MSVWILSRTSIRGAHRLSKPAREDRGDDVGCRSTILNTKTNTDTYTGTDIDNDTNANIALDYKLPKNLKLKRFRL